MILAGIDIGTNTLRLLVAEAGRDSFHEIYADRKITRLGQDLDLRGMLASEAQYRALKALEDFAEQIQRHAAIQTAAHCHVSHKHKFIPSPSCSGQFSRLCQGEHRYLCDDGEITRHAAIHDRRSVERRPALRHPPSDTRGNRPSGTRPVSPVPPAQIWRPHRHAGQLPVASPHP